jgi:ElaB/YqjD/DUF883 family membrane-anchored ribosome-binding protein
MKEDESIPSAAAGDSWQTKQVFESARSDLQSHLTDVKDAARQAVHEVKETASVTAAAARDGYQAIREDASAHFTTYRDELEQYIREQPLKSIGAAALAGLILGLMVRR